jgi:hypothetical protein
MQRARGTTISQTRPLRKQAPAPAAIERVQDSEISTSGGCSRESTLALGEGVWGNVLWVGDLPSAPMPG